MTVWRELISQNCKTIIGFIDQQNNTIPFKKGMGFLPPRYFWQSGYIQLETDNKQPVVQRSLCAAANLKIKLSASFIKGDNNSNLKSEGLAPYFDR